MKAELEYDNDPVNPLEDHCTLPALSDVSEYNMGIDLPALTRKQIIDNKDQILAITDYSSFREMAENNMYRHGSSALDAINDEIIDCMPQNYSKKIDYIKEFLDIAGIEYGYSYRNGYSQGQFAECIVLASDSEPMSREQLDAWASEYTLMAIGNVYAATVYERCNCSCSNCGGWKSVDSVGGIITEDQDAALDELLTEFA